MKLKRYLQEADMNGVFTNENVDDVVEKLKKGIKGYEQLNVQKSTLGGPQNVSIHITVGLDPKDTWQNGIFENSTYFRMSWNGATTKGYQTEPNVMEVYVKPFTMGDKTLRRKMTFRKYRPKSVEDAIKKINEYIKKVKSLIS